MNVTEIEAQVMGLLPIMVLISLIVGMVAGFSNFRKRKEEGEEPGMDPLDIQIREIYKLQKKHKKG